MEMEKRELTFGEMEKINAGGLINELVRVLTDLIKKDEEKGPDVYPTTWIC